RCSDSSRRRIRTPLPRGSGRCSGTGRRRSRSGPKHAARSARRAAAGRTRDGTESPTKDGGGGTPHIEADYGGVLTRETLDEGFAGCGARVERARAGIASLLSEPFPLSRNILLSATASS